MNLFNTDLKNLQNVVVCKDLTIQSQDSTLQKPGILTSLFGSKVVALLSTLFKGSNETKKVDSEKLFDELKQSMTGSAKRLTLENYEVFTTNLDVLRDKDILTSNQVTVLKIMAAKINPKV